MATMTRGRKALLAILQRTTAKEVAARVKVFPSTVSRWASGHSRPWVSGEVGLEAQYDIPRSAWCTCHHCTG